MRPELIKIQVFSVEMDVASYTAFLLLAAVVVLVLGTASAARRSLDWRRSLACLIFSLAATFIGARLLHRALRPQEHLDDPSLLLSLRPIGFFLYGGLSLTIATTPLICRLLRVNTWRLADSVSPALGVGIALARVGCFLNGCCFGTTTKLPWGVTFPRGSPAFFSQFSSGTIGLLDAPLPVHPAQLYEAAAALLAAVMALWILRRNAREGMAFLGFISFFTVFRLLKLLVMPASRGMDRWFEPLLYALVIAVCSVAAVLRSRCPHSHGVSTP